MVDIGYSTVLMFPPTSPNVRLVARGVLKKTEFSTAFHVKVARHLQWPPEMDHTLSMMSVCFNF